MPAPSFVSLKKKTDEWIHRGLEFAGKEWECRSEDRDGGGTGGEKQDVADKLQQICNSCNRAATELVDARRCGRAQMAGRGFSKAGSSGNKYVSKAQLKSRCTRFLKELQKPTAASIQQTEKEQLVP